MNEDRGARADAPGGPPDERPGGLTCDEVRDLGAGFVLDALGPEDTAAVRAHLASCPDPHTEIEEMASVLPALMGDVPQVEPPEALRSRILTAAANDLADRVAEVELPTPIAPVEPGPADRSIESESPANASIVPILPSDAAAAETSPSEAAPPAPSIIDAASVPALAEPVPIPVRPRTPVALWALRIAAVIAVALLAGWNLLLQGQLDSARAYEQRVAAVLDVAAQEGSVTAILTPGTGAGASGLAAVGADGTVTIAMRELTATRGDQVYEAWVIDGGASPVALGSFRVGGDGTGFLESTGAPARAGIVLAVTLEPRPGATAPSSDPVSLGTATASG
jgi:hypothetical protein